MPSTVQRGAKSAFLQRVRRTIERYGMLAGGERVLVAVSGGPDSTALLAALHALAPRWRIELRAAHLNHQLRGAEARRDQECARRVAAALGVACAVGSADALAGGNLEARARDARYAFLDAVADATGCTRIATGHTLDDQAETVLLRLLRGTGSDGLAGVRAVRDGRVIRPLLDCSRREVLAFLAARGLPYCEDSSNGADRFLRNRVRHEVLPLLQALNPAASRHLAALAERAAADAEVLDTWVHSRMTGLDGALEVSAVGAVPPALRGRMVRGWLRARRGDLRRLTAAHVEAVVALAAGTRPNGRVCLPGGVVVRAYDRLLWSPAAAAAAETACLPVPGSLGLPSGWCLRAELVAAPGVGERPADLWGMVADAAAVTAPLVVRAPRAGDRMRPLGMRGRRKLQDLFVDRKWPLSARRSCPVIECGGQILWVPGVARSTAALLTGATRTAVRLVADRRGTGIAGAPGLC